MSSDQISIPSGIEEQIRALRLLLQQGDVTIKGKNTKGQSIAGPVRDVLVQILEHVQDGQAITIIPANHELSSQEAADMLGVSRQYVVRILEDGKLPFHKAGSHRRIYRDDLIAYKAARDQGRLAALDQIARAEVAAGTYDVFVPSEE